MTADGLRVSYGDVAFDVLPEDSFLVGREGDLRIDDPYLHRRFLHFERRDGLWFVTNVGSRLSATVLEPLARIEAYLGPGSPLPLVCADMVVSFTTTTTSYRLDVRIPSAVYAPPILAARDDETSSITLLPELTDDQLLMLLVLAEARLRGNVGGGSAVFPSSVEAARRLGWTTKKFDRKVDNVCEKFDRLGVAGLRGEGLGLNAANRRARLVEYAVGTGLVTKQDLATLDTFLAKLEQRSTLD